MRKITLLFLVLLTHDFISQTNVTGNIVTSTNWIKANSPYIIKNNIIVYYGSTLTIENGVEVKVDDGYYITLQGFIDFKGITGDSVIMHSSDAVPTRTAWYGIKFDGGGQIRMNCAVLKDAEWGLEFWNSQTPVSDSSFISNSRFSGNSRAMSAFSLNRPKLYIRDCIFNSNGMGIANGETENLHVNNCNFFNNTGGIGDTAVLCLNIKVDSCNFYNNLSGAAIYFDSQPGARIAGCNFYNNSVRGLAIASYYGNHTSTFASNKIYNNNTGLVFFANSPIADTLEGNNSAICSNTVNLKMTTNRNLTIQHICWCTDDSTTIRSTIKDGYNYPPLGLVQYNPYNKQCNLNYPQLLKENQLSSEILVYPNPFQNLISLSPEFSGTVKLYGPLGNIVFSGNSNNTINTGNLPSGIYLMILENSSMRLSKKLVRE